MSVGTWVFLALVYLGGVAVAANFQMSATRAGNYLIGRQRLGIFGFRHRRERLTRAFATFACFVAATSLPSAIPALAGSSLFNVGAAVLGLAPPIGAWFATASVHGAEISDEEPNKHLRW